MEKSNKIPAEWKNSLTSVASYMAIWIGMAWSASFLCSMYGLKYPLLSSVGNVLGILSIYMIYTNVRNYRCWIKDIRFASCWRLSFCICIFAGLITDAVQYAYFAFLDNGMLMSMMLSMMETPEYEQMMEQLMPGVSTQEIGKIISSMTIRSIMAQLITFNLLISLPISFITALFGSIAKTKGSQGENPFEK